MSDFSSNNTPQISRRFGQRFDNAHFGVFQYITSSGLQFPLLDLPSSIPTASWSMLDGSKTTMTEASKLLTQCYKECQLIYFNLKFFQFVVSEPSFRTMFANDIDLDLLANLYLSLSGIAPSLNDVIWLRKETIRKTLAYYLGEGYFISSLYGIKTAILGDARKTVEAEFAQKLTALPPFRHNKTEFKVSREQAERDIKIVSRDMEMEIDKFFAAKVSSHVFSIIYTSTGVVAAKLTAELLRQINPALTQARAEELAPYLSQAIEKSKVTTMIGKAMFLAQVLHEVGTRPGLDENGGDTTKPYNGERYPYFFYMYDKDSPNPDRQRVAKILGNTQAGDGEKFHGRGYLQLTGRDKYTRAGKSLGYNFLDDPDLAANPSIAVETTAWYWLGGNGKNCNDFTTKDTLENLTQITRIINGGTNGLEDRTRLYQNAKKALGIKQ